MKYFHFAIVTLGVMLLGALVYKIGLHALQTDLLRLGWGLIPFILLEGMVDIFHTLGWRHCLTGPHRSLPYHKLFRIRLAGGSINYFTPTATLGGEVTKGTLLASDQGGTEAISSVVIGKVSYALTQLLFVALGSAFFLWGTQLPPGVWPVMLTGNVLLVTGVIGFLLVQKYGKLGAMIRWLVRRRVGGKLAQQLAGHITAVDDDLKRFYRQRPKDLPLSMCWHAVGLVCSVMKTWYFLVVMTPHGSLFVAAGIWFLSSWCDLLTFPVPLGIGVQEGIKVFAFRTLGFNLAMGLTYGVALRIEQLFWAGLGLLTYMSLLPKKKSLVYLRQTTKSKEGEQHAAANPPVDSHRY